MSIEFGLVTLFLLLFDQLLTILRTGLLNARASRLSPLPGSSLESAARTQALMEHPRLRLTLRIARILTRLSVAGTMLAFLGSWQSLINQPVLWGAISLALVGLIVFISELAVEHIVMRTPEFWALRFTFLAKILVFLYTPITWPISLAAWQSTEVSLPVTEDEIKTWAQSEKGEGGLEREERQMIYSILELGGTLVREIMIPRVDMVAVEVKEKLSAAVKASMDSGHSRLPVYEDTVDNVVGVLYAKDLLKVMGLPAEKTTSLRDLTRPVYYVPETKKANALLAEMQAQRIHMALIVDEYGSVVGLVTLEDILEEITGEIRDEYDGGEDVAFQVISEDEYLFQGGIDLDEFNDVIDGNLPKIESDTLAGYIYDRLGRIPSVGETLQAEGLLLTVEQVIGRRIRRVRAKRILPMGKGLSENVE